MVTRFLGKVFYFYLFFCLDAKEPKDQDPKTFLTLPIEPAMKSLKLARIGYWSVDHYCRRASDIKLF